MHVEIDRVLVRLTETTLRELIAEIESIKAKHPSRKTVLMKSDYSTMRFLVDLVTSERTQEAYQYKAVMPERKENAKMVTRPSNGKPNVSGN